MIIVFVLYGIVAIRYATIDDGSRGDLQRPQPPLPPQQPPMSPQQIEAMIKDVVVDVELCCSICLEDLKKVDDNNDDGDDYLRLTIHVSSVPLPFYLGCFRRFQKIIYLSFP